MAKKTDGATIVETPQTTFDPIAEANGAKLTEIGPTEYDPPSTPAKTSEMILLEAPMSHTEKGYATTTIALQGMTSRQSAAAKRLFISLGCANERVQMKGVGHPDGKVVNSYADTVRWLFERLADGWEAETGQDITKGLQF